MTPAVGGPKKRLSGAPGEGHRRAKGRTGDPKSSLMTSGKGQKRKASDTRRAIERSQIKAFSVDPNRGKSIKIQEIRRDLRRKEFDSQPKRKETPQKARRPKLRTGRDRKSKHYLETTNKRRAHRDHRKRNKRGTPQRGTSDSPNGLTVYASDRQKTLGRTLKNGVIKGGIWRQTD